MSDIPPTPPRIIFGMQPTHSQAVYANTCGFNLTPYDLTMVLGRQSDVPAPGTIVDGVSVSLSLPFLKVLAVHLSHIVAELETIQPIMVPLASVEGAQKQAAVLAKGMREANLRP